MLSFRKKRSIWNTLSVGQFQSIQELKHLDEWNQIRSLVAIVDKLDFEHVDSIPLIELKKRANEINGQLKKIPFTPFKKTIKLGGKRWYITRMFDEIETGQFIEMMEWIKNKDEIVKNIDKIIASLIVESPIFQKRKLYDGSNHKKRCEMVRNEMLMIDALGLSNFFLTTWIQFCQTIPEYSNKMMMELNQLMMEPNSPNNSVG